MIKEVWFEEEDKWGDVGWSVLMLDMEVEWERKIYERLSDILELFDLGGGGR